MITDARYIVDKISTRELTHAAVVLIVNAVMLAFFYGGLAAKVEQLEKTVHLLVNKSIPSAKKITAGSLTGGRGGGSVNTVRETTTSPGSSTTYIYSRTQRRIKAPQASGVGLINTTSNHYVRNRNNAKKTIHRVRIRGPDHRVSGLRDG